MPIPIHVEGELNDQESFALRFTPQGVDGQAVTPTSIELELWGPSSDAAPASTFTLSDFDEDEESYSVVASFDEPKFWYVWLKVTDGQGAVKIADDQVYVHPKERP